MPEKKADQSRQDIYMFSQSHDICFYSINMKFTLNNKTEYNFTAHRDGKLSLALLK